MPPRSCLSRHAVGAAAAALALLLLCTLAGARRDTDRSRVADGDDAPPFLVGAGVGDVTGPASDVNMMGYARPDQRAAGVHTRQWARAYVVADAEDPSQRVAVVVVEACMATHAVRAAVLQRLASAVGAGVYTFENLLLSGTHTHAGAGGFLHFVTYDITSMGFVVQTFDALVDGIADAVVAAHAALAPGRLWLARGRLEGASVNRSPSAYRANPAAERRRWSADGDTDKGFTVLRLSDASGAATRGAVAWFGVHATSLPNTNRLLSSDNKGFAAQCASARAGGAPVAFAQAAEGDVSPNTRGAFCGDGDVRCDEDSSTCGGRSETCHGRGPAWPDAMASAAAIGAAQCEAALELLGAGNATELRGPLGSRHTWADFGGGVQLPDGNRTCPAALGHSFAAGTTDGPGAFDFKQGDDTGTPFWRAVSRFLAPPSAAQAACQAPKPVLLDIGEVDQPYPWAPSILPLQALRLGALVVLAVPAEFTTMAGRRLRDAAAAALARGGAAGVAHVQVAGLSNEYSNYVATEEEYAVQRYEGASTLYGPHTLAAHTLLFARLAEALASGAAVPPGDPPANLSGVQMSLLPPVVDDEVPPFARFGGVLRDVSAAVARPGDAVSAVFHSACLRNDLRRGGSFLAVERYDGAERGWAAALGDDAWDTTLAWGRPAALSPTSHATVEWRVAAGTPAGVYRLCHSGVARRLGALAPFRGCSGNFTVLHAPAAAATARM